MLQNMRHGTTTYQPGTTVLTYEEELSVSPDQPSNLQALLGHPGDTEASSNSEGSHATGDSGRYSHDETEMTNLSSSASSRPASLTGEDSAGSDCSGPAEELNKLSGESQTDLKLTESVENCRCHPETQGGSQTILSL